MDGWSRHYPPDVFPSLWEKVEELVNDGRFLISEEVYSELLRKDDDLAAWVKERKKLVLVATCQKVQKSVSLLMQHPEHSKLVDVNRNRGQADPFVIAVAQVRDSQVVTGEIFDLKRKNPRIPDVCHQLGVPWCSFLGIAKGEQWQF